MENKKDNQKLEKPQMELDTSTQLACERTFLANERTLIAWLRTAIALVSAGLGVVKFLDAAGPYYLMKVLGILLVITGELSYIFAYKKYKSVNSRICHVQGSTSPSWIMFPLNITVLLMSIISLLVIFDN